MKRTSPKIPKYEIHYQLGIIMTDHQPLRQETIQALSLFRSLDAIMRQTPLYPDFQKKVIPHLQAFISTPTTMRVQTTVLPRPNYQEQEELVSQIHLAVQYWKGALMYASKQVIAESDCLFYLQEIENAEHANT